MKHSREFHLILHGATGFTGRLAAEELHRNAPKGLRWAVSGRTPEKVNALAQKYEVPGIVTESLQNSDVESLASRADVILSCAGPYSVFGTPLVQACVKYETHYADLSGELPWIHQIIQQYHEICVQKKITLIPSSGFDSVPSDLAVHSMRQALSRPCKLYGLFKIKGGLNGGTLHSGLALAEKQTLSAPAPPSPFAIPYLKRWAAPFLMAPVNEDVVARSQSDFPYQEFLLVRTRGQASRMSGLLRLSTRMLASPFGRKLLRLFGPKPGQGPSKKKIEEGFADLTLLAGSLEQPLAVHRWNWTGDPSNLITVRCLVQTGLALAAGEAKACGVLTPSGALGSALTQRLLKIGAVQHQTLP
jgi:short subunit dehydrogenase-like uncharacterized protein